MFHGGSFLGIATPHILVVGLQEVVQLNASQIMSVDPERRIIWDGLFLKLLNEKHAKQPFSLLVSHQVVGTCISIFVRSDLIDMIRNVEISSKKTGLGGIAGNKGSVAVRMLCCDNSMCFISSHFTAGQANVFDRDRDINLAMAELQWSEGKDVECHDYVIWIGDMNYRVDMDREKALDMIVDKKFSHLFEFDQLRKRMTDGLIFPGFKEAEVMFAPTYKYDSGTNVYDTR